MKRTITLLFVLVGNLCFANMASPVWPGTFSCSAFSSQNIDVLHEKITITLDQEFHTAAFVVDYLIETPKDGKQIPLLFYAQDYWGDFKVWVDGIETQILDISGEPYLNLTSVEKNFQNSFEESFPNEKRRTKPVLWSEYDRYSCSIDELKYFKTDLTQGKHHILVRYSANAWADNSDWISNRSFRYSLSPARYWKSFRGLEISLNALEFDFPLKTNLGEPTSGKVDSLAVWEFQKLPGDFIEIQYLPEINWFAKLMIALGPLGIAGILALILITLHVRQIKRRPSKGNNKIIIAFNFLVPLSILLALIFSPDLVDFLIGPEAGRYHGYTFLAIFLYPVLLPTYWLAMVLVKSER
ncbi:MAG: hypothetical protein H6581_16395 [Bacteroidia bacterium]|nr:hypothetical protein [Bacteroidia bacterium]